MYSIIYLPPNCGFPHSTHKEISSGFHVLNYCSQMEELIKASSCYLHQVWRESAGHREKGEVIYSCICGQILVASGTNKTHCKNQKQI